MPLRELTYGFERWVLCRASALLLLGMVIGVASYPTITQAQDDFFGTIDVDLDSGADGDDRPYSLIGWITEKVSYGLEDPGPLFSRQEKELNRVETSLFAQFDTGIGRSINLRISGKVYHDAIYQLRDDINFSEDERDKFRNRFEVKDFYLEGQTDSGLYLKIGEQILAWGMAEYLRVTDLINTEDQYTFGQQDLEDIRLQVPALLASYSLGGWVLDGVVTYDAGRNDIGPKGDEFDQFIGLRDLEAGIWRHDPQRRAEVFVRASSHYSRGDLQFVAAEFNDNALSVDQMLVRESMGPLLSLTQNRMRAIGFAANWTQNSWLFFGELGAHFDKAVRPGRDSIFMRDDGWDEKDQILSVLGVEYSGFRNLLLTFELDNTHSRGHDEFMQADRDQSGFGARLYFTAINDRLEVLAVWNEPDDSSRFTRLSVDYHWTDNLELGMLWVDYHSESDSILYEFRNNDVFQLQLRYNFQY